MIDANRPPTPGEGGSWLLVYGQSWLAALAPRLRPVLEAEDLRRVVVLPDRARGEEGGLAAREESLLAQAGVDEVFAPRVGTFWPEKAATRVAVEGSFRRHGAAFRPGYYVERLTATMRLVGLFGGARIVEFGCDYHWMAMWRRASRDLAVGPEPVFLAPIREEDGLMARPENALLSRGDRQAAREVVETLKAAEELFRSGEVEAARLLGRTSARLMRVPGYRVQYLSLADPETLDERDVARPGDVLLVGGFCGSVRLEEYWVLG